MANIVQPASWADVPLLETNTAVLGGEAGPMNFQAKALVARSEFLDDKIDALDASLSAGSGASLVGYLPAGVGAVATTVQSKLRESVSVKDFGAVGDGVTDDTAALIKAATYLTNGQTLDFVGGNYLISYQGASYSSVYGNVIFDLLGKSDLTFLGNGATIKIVNHNITTHGGLRFMNFKGCKRINISGFNFDMTFTGVNTSSSFYPFCGAITAVDDDSATPAFSTLNSDFIINDCKFKLYHPYGNWATTSNPYSGDSNNGYKLFSVFASGPHTPTDYNNQSRNISVTNSTWLKGHNGYGIWFWAWNNCHVTGCVAEDWVTKYSNSAGVFQNGGVAWIRHIPFRTEGIIVDGNHFRAKPNSERVSGFEGVSVFYVHADNMGGNWTKGMSIVKGNNIILGSGYLTKPDQAVFFNGYGSLIVDGNIIDGHNGNVPVAGVGGVNVLELTPSGFGGTGDGACSILVSNNVFGSWLFGGIYFTNGSNVSAEHRRCKSFVLTNNVSLSGDNFLRQAAYSTLTYDGCEEMIVAGNTIQEANPGAYPAPSVNNYGMFFSLTVPTDVVVVRDNIIKDKTYDIRTDLAYVATGMNFKRFQNFTSNITIPYYSGDRYIGDSTEIGPVATVTGIDPKFAVVNTATGNKLELYQQSTTSYILPTGPLHIYTGLANQVVVDTNVLRPAADNTKTLGNASFRWSAVYAGTGTINTSDEREKQDIEELDGAEKRVASALKGLVKKFRFKDAVQSKGDKARIHIGVMAQAVMAAFHAEGLDPLRYSIICYDEWDSEFDEDGNEVRPAGNRYGVRYEELLSFIIAAL